MLVCIALHCVIIHRTTNYESFNVMRDVILLSRDLMLGQKLDCEFKIPCEIENTDHVGDTVCDFVHMTTSSTCHVSFFDVHLRNQLLAD